VQRGLLKTFELGFTKPRPAAVALAASELDGHTGTYRRQLTRFDVTRMGAGLRVVSCEINEATGADSGLRREFDLEPLEPGRFRVTSLDSRDSTVDFFALPDGGGQPRDVIRIWGRVAPRPTAG